MDRMTGRFNPYLPLPVCVPDGEPKLFEGRVYIYGSKDEHRDRYCSYHYHVYSAPAEDLTDWRDDGEALASRAGGRIDGEGGLIPWSDGLLWAPDVVKRGSTYYLYFCQEDGSEGVAESNRPYGPFVNPRRITMNGAPIEGIDPSVLEDKGEFWYTWGQGHCHLARLNDDMCTLDPATYVESIISHDDGEQGFHEGSSLRKIGDTFVMVYASEYTDAYPNRGGAPTHLDYAVSSRIEGPYERRGKIIDNVGIDPASWNDHGSILKVGDQWYVFYHGSSENREFGRRARAERIEVDEKEVRIKEAEMTSSGFALSLDPADTIPAACFYRVSGGAYLANREGFPVTNLKSGAGLAYRYVDFGETEKGEMTMVIGGRILERGTVTVKVREKREGACVPCNGCGSCFVTAGSADFEPEGSEIRVKLHGLKGLMDVILEFTSDADGEIAEPVWIRFQ